MDVSCVSYILIGAGAVFLLLGSLIKWVTRKKVKDLEGFIGIVDKKQIENGESDSYL